MTDTAHRTLVVGGGGVTGIAWATGLILGLEKADVRLREADRLVGTSAGAAVTAQLTGHITTQVLYDRQIEGTVQELAGGFRPLALARVALPLLLCPNETRALRTVGRFAATQGGGMASERRAVIQARIDDANWDPKRDLRITSIDIDTGKLTVFEQGGTATLADAVEASCAVPGVWPVVTIAGHRYMDGGMLSPANVPVAGKTAKIVVIAPMEKTFKAMYSPQNELKALGAPGVVIHPDDEAKASMGKDALNPSARVAAAKAGLAQAKRVVKQLSNFW